MDRKRKARGDELKGKECEDCQQRRNNGVGGMRQDVVNCRVVRPTSAGQEESGLRIRTEEVA